MSLSPVDGEDVLARYRAIRAELEAYGEHLAGRPELVVLTKLDTVDEAAAQQAIQAFLACGIEAPMAISAVSGTGLSELKSAIWSRLQSMTAPETPSAPN